jgi:predicted GH43/DUF377 family glycosyl hydrolase
MNPFVLRIGNEYHLYYSGADAQGHQRICLATSPVDNTRAWNRHGVVLDRGEPGAFDHNWVVLPHVVKFGDRWHLYYTANSGVGEGLSAFPGIGLAFSDDGRTFQKYENNPILTATRTEGDPDCQGVAGGSVIHIRLPSGEMEWRFYYTGCPTLGDDVFLNQQKTVCYAVSNDGIEWRKRGAVMFRDPARDYIDVAAAGPVVWQETNGSFRMMLSAIGTRWGFYSICYAESDDGITWHQGEHYGDDLTLGPTGDGWERQMVAYPAVIKEDARLRLFYCGNGYGKTGIGTAVSSPLRANAVAGHRELRIVAHQTESSWTLRLPEGFSCDQGSFLAHFHPAVDWTGPNEVGTLWHEWEADAEDLQVLNSNESVERLGLKFIRGIWYRALVTHTENGLDLKISAKNMSSETFQNVSGIVCLGYPDERFQDPALERTFVQVNGKLTALKDTDRGTGDPCRTHYLVEGQNPIHHHAPSYWGKLSRTVSDSGAILRTSSCGTYTIGTAWDSVSEIWDNQDAHACIHSNFSLGDMQPGETKSVTGRIVLVSGNAETAQNLLSFE